MLTRKDRQSLRLELASLGVAYLSGDPIPKIIERFGLSGAPVLRAHIRHLAAAQWRAHRRFRCGIEPRAAARVESLIRSYENGLKAGRRGSPAEPNPCIGEHATAWRLGHVAGSKERCAR